MGKIYKMGKEISKEEIDSAIEGLAYIFDMPDSMFKTVFPQLKEEFIKTIKSGEFEKDLIQKGVSSEEREKIANDFKELKLAFQNEGYSSEKIEFLGHLSQSEVKKYVADAKFSVIPSEWYENNPLSVIESLCLGTPVAGARIGGIPELVKPGMGFLFRPGDADSLKRTIETAWEGQFDYGWISSNSINRFSEHRYLEEILDIYSR